MRELKTQAQPRRRSRKERSESDTKSENFRQPLVGLTHPPAYLCAKAWYSKAPRTARLLQLPDAKITTAKKGMTAPMGGSDESVEIDCTRRSRTRVYGRFCAVADISQRIHSYPWYMVT